MKDYRLFEVAGHCFAISGKHLCNATSQIDGFHPFEVSSKEPAFTFAEGCDIPQAKKAEYTFSYEDVSCTFHSTPDGYLLILKPLHEACLHLWTCNDNSKVYLSGNLSIRLYRFALWVGFGLMTLPHNTLAIHSSCVVYKGKAVMVLGESGTGKSTHTSLWMANIDGATLLNDDSPILRICNGKILAYGSPWSGKKPCYVNKCHEVSAFIRLSQAPYNRIQQLAVLQAYGAIHPSCPPVFAYSDKLYDMVSDTLAQAISEVAVYHLACLPNKEAADLACRTIFPLSSN